MGVKISGLPSNGNVSLNDVFPENHSGTTYKATLSDVKDLFGISELESAIEASAITSSASGEIASFPDGADALPFKSVAVNIAPLQSGSGDPSPDNVRPISGWTAVNVTRCGKNLCPTTTITLGNGSPRTAEVYFAKPLPIGTYTFSASVTINTAVSNQPGVQFISTSGTNIGSATMAVGTTGTLTKTITVTDPILRLYFYLGTTDYNNGKTIVFENIQVEVGSTATAYEQYTAQTYPITLPTEAGTVYGGTLDVVKGTLTVTWTAREIISSSGFQKSSSYPGSFYIIASLLGMKNAPKGIIQCSHLKYIGTPTAANYKYGTCGLDSAVNLYLFDSSSATLEDLQNYLTEQKNAGTPVVIAGLMLTPTTYTLTPTEIRTLLGYNTLWADAGAVDVQYPADTKLYIDGKIAELQALVLENNG